MLALLAGQLAIHWETIALCYLNRIILILAELTSDFTILHLEVIFHVVIFALDSLFLSLSLSQFHFSLFLHCTRCKKNLRRKKNLLSKLAEITQFMLLESGQWSGVGEFL